MKFGLLIPVKQAACYQSLLAINRCPFQNNSQCSIGVESQTQGCSASVVLVDAPFQKEHTFPGSGVDHWININSRRKTYIYKFKLYDSFVSSNTCIKMVLTSLERSVVFIDINTEFNLAIESLNWIPKHCSTVPVQVIGPFTKPDPAFANTQALAAAALMLALVPAALSAERFRCATLKFSSLGKVIFSGTLNTFPFWGSSFVEVRPDNVIALAKSAGVGSKRGHCNSRCEGTAVM